MSIVAGLIQNASILLALVLTYSLLLERLPRHRLSTQSLQGVLFGTAALIGMIAPVNLSPGVFFDARSVVISMAGLFGGPLVAAMATLIAAAYRAWLGGIGAIMGIGVLITAASLGLVMRALSQANRLKINPLTLMLFGLLVHLLSLCWLFTFPADLRQVIFSQIALPFVTILPLISVLLGSLLHMMEQRHQSEQLLRQSEQRLKEAKRIAGLGYWEWDLVSGKKAWSPEVYALYGQDPALSPEPFPEVAQLFSSANWPALCVATQDAMRSGKGFEQEVEVVRPDGSRRWAMVRSEAAQDATGKTLRLHGTIQDITEQRELLSRIEKIAAHVPGVLYQYQQWPDGRAAFPYASHRMKDIYGVEPSEIIQDATPIFEAVHPEDRPQLVQTITASMRQQTLWQDSFRVVHPDQRVLWVEGDASPEPQADGSTLWHGYVRDITARKLQAARLELAASVLEHSLEGIVITDAENRIVDINPGFSRITGYSKDEVLGANPRILASGRHDARVFAEMWSRLNANGLWQGELWNRRKDGTLFAALLSISAVSDKDTGQLRNYIGVFADVTQSKLHQAELDKIAHYDLLTGLPNRRLLMHRLHQALAHNLSNSRILAVGYMDLDGFKQINDTHGHAVGDQFLVKVTEALQNVLSDKETLGRLGGDEFGLLLTDLAHPEDCRARMTLVLETLQQPIEINGLVHQVSASMGVSLCPPDRADADALLRHADQAMYHAKESGKNQFKFYDAGQETRIEARTLLLDQFKQAMDHNALVLHFQPQVDMITREVKRTEALIRWQHPQRGLLMPGDFLPDIEGSEHEIALGLWVLKNALKTHAQWQRQGLHMPVSVNVGARQLLKPGFFEALKDLLAQFPEVVPSDLEIEILETTALEDFARAQDVLRACKRLGVRFALDDFGTGYSSLAYFRLLPMDVLKIDQSFVRAMLDDPNDLEIVDSVVKLSNTFNRVIVAEGVETVQHAALLAWIGCRYGQGYGFSRPIPAEDLPGWIDRWSQHTTWCELDAATQRTELPLLVAIQNHRCWMHHLSQALMQADGERLARLESDHGRFEHWYNHRGHADYAHWPEFQLLGARYQQVLKIGQTLVADLQRSGIAPPTSALHPLQQASDALLSELRQMVRRINAISPTPGPDAR